MKTAVVTMVYNEPEFVPIWTKYYGSIFPKENVYIIDHGTDDGSLDYLKGINVIRIPRTPKDNRQRSRLIRDFVSGLLNYYDTVIHTDIDEILIPDPRKWENLAHFCTNRSHKVVTAIGLNIVHRVSREKDYNPEDSVMSQRKWGLFVSPMCKPSVVSEAVTFGDGFHGCTSKPEFEDLYLFHLRYFDKNAGLARLARTRAMAWSSPKAGTHQRVEDEQWITKLGNLDKINNGPKLGSPAADNEVADLIAKFYLSSNKDERGIYRIKPDFQGKYFFEIPENFSHYF